MTQADCTPKTGFNKRSSTTVSPPPHSRVAAHKAAVAAAIAESSANRIGVKTAVAAPSPCSNRHRTVMANCPAFSGADDTSGIVSGGFTMVFVFHSDGNRFVSSTDDVARIPAAGVSKQVALESEHVFHIVHPGALRDDELCGRESSVGIAVSSMTAHCDVDRFAHHAEHNCMFAYIVACS
jgi:hypothetical protein